MIVRFACLMLVFTAGPVMAQPHEPPISIPGGGPPEPPGPPAPPPRQLFISPAGEPFRAEPGEPYPVAAWFARADTDSDGVLTLTEFTADSLAFFDTLDTDKDRVVDGFETSDYEARIAPEIRGIAAPREPLLGNNVRIVPPSRAERAFGQPSMLGGFTPRRPGPPPRQGAGQFGLLDEPHPVRGADADLDYKISRAEAGAAARMRFGLLDGDGDSRLTLTDLPRTPAEARRDGPPDEGRRKPPPK